MGMKDKIRPEEVTAVRLWNAFDNMETEFSARWIVLLCEEMGGWLPFTREQIEALYRRHGHRGFSFNRLDGNTDWLVKDGDTYQVTDEFVGRCYMSSEKCKGKSAQPTTVPPTAA